MLALDLAPPANWQDFESLCCDLWRRLWADPEAQKNGRSGQPQAGVDIFGRPGDGGEWVGVQCKQKGRGERLTGGEIAAEAAKARSFAPALSSFIVATTAPRDIEAQRAARELTDDPALPFTVSVFSWADLADELRKHPDLLRRYYPAAVADGVRVSISRLPVPGPVFVGRDAELGLLHRAWDAGRNLVSIVAWGGIGKSALVHRFLGQLAAAGWRGAERVYGWSFYSQGTTERLASADFFVDRALRWLGDPDPTSGSPRDRGLRLADRVREGRTLLVLDGVEPLQHPPGPLEGRLEDPALAALVKELAAENPGLCVVTTREALADRTALADALHQAGRRGSSSAAFREAEAMQAERQPEYPRLYSLQGYQYCDLLLGAVEAGPRLWSGLDGTVGSAGEAEALRQACREVLERAAQTLGRGGGVPDRTARRIFGYNRGTEVTMSTITIQLPDHLAAELTASRVAREQLDSFIAASVEAWLRHRRAKAAEPGARSWPEAFEDSAVAFVDRLIEDNHDLFDELALR